MTTFEWLVQLRFKEVTGSRENWSFALSDQTCLGVGCLWRLLEGGRIRFTSDDDGHQFGMSSPVDACAEVNARLSGAIVSAVQLREGTLDLTIEFSTGHVLEVVPTSLGYEAWEVMHNNRRFIAVGGGEIAAFDWPP